MTESSDIMSFDGTRAYNHVSHLATGIGPRFACGKGEREAARYIAHQFQSFGLSVTTQRAPCDSFAVDNASLDICLDGRWRSIQVVPVVYSAGTSRNGIEAEVAICHDVMDLANARDKIALVCKWPGMRQRAHLKAAGVRAVLLVDQRLEGPPRTRVVPPAETAGYRTVPTASVRHPDASDIVKAGRARARLLIVKRQRKSYSLNVIGELKGRSDKIVAMCAHYDSLPAIPGAQDNASGTSLVIEMARIMARRKPEMTMRFIAFGAEEASLIGSGHYAAALLGTAKLDKHMLAFNVDVVGAPLGQYSLTYIGTADIKKKLETTVLEEGIACGVSSYVGTSDNTPLSAVGIPSIYMARHAEATAALHTPGDTDRFISAESLAMGGRLAERFLTSVAVDSARWPFMRSIPKRQFAKIRAVYRRRGYIWPEIPGDTTGL